MSQEDKKRRKELKRRSHLDEKRRSKEKFEKDRQRAAQYPDIKFTGRAEPAFEQLIRESVARISFDSPAFPEWERRVYRTVKSHGYGEAYDLLRQLDTAAAEGGEPPRDPWFATNFGTQVFLGAGEGLEPFLLANDVVFTCSDRSIVGEFRQLRLEKSPSGQGRIRVSPKKPTVSIAGKEYVAGFSKHAMDQIADRVTPSWRRYAGHGDAFYFFHDCIHFAECKFTHGDSPHGFSLFEKVTFGTNFRVIPKLVLTHLPMITDDGSGIYARIGYCPVVLDGGFAKAKTFVPPGYSATPEAALYRDKTIPHEIRMRIKEVGTSEDPGHGFLHSDPALLHYFHENGFPQAVLGSDPCFAHVAK